MAVLFAESIDVKSGVNHVLSSGGKGDGKQDRILANYGIIKKVAEQECGINELYVQSHTLGLVKRAENSFRLIHRSCSPALFGSWLSPQRT